MPKTTLSQEVSGDRQEVAAQADTTPLTLPRLCDDSLAMNGRASQRRDL